MNSLKVCTTGVVARSREATPGVEAFSFLRVGPVVYLNTAGPNLKELCLACLSMHPVVNHLVTKGDATWASKVGIPTKQVEYVRNYLLKTQND